MFNIILTGKILDEIQFKKLIDKIIKLKKEKKINEIILSIWKNQLLSKTIIFFLKKNKIIIVRNDYKKFAFSLKYQIHLLKNGLKKIKNKKALIIKLRNDINFQVGQIKKLSNLDFKVHSKKKVLSTKFWVPYFEATKPFYIADEIFVTSYKNLRKITTINKYYGNKFFDAGQTHINWYLGLFLNDFNVDKYVNYYGKSYHFCSTRFFHLNKMINNQEYLEILLKYYKILDEYFIIGTKIDKNFSLNTKTVNFFNQNLKINFHDKTLDDVFSIKNSNVKYSGHIFSRSSNDVKKIIKLTKNKISKSQTKDLSINKNPFFLKKIITSLQHLYNYFIFKIIF